MKTLYNYLEVNLASFQKKTPLKFSFLHLGQHNKVICLQQHVLNFIKYVHQTILNAKTAQPYTNSCEHTNKYHLVKQPENKIIHHLI